MNNANYNMDSNVRYTNLDIALCLTLKIA